MKGPATYDYQVIEDKDGGVHLFVFDKQDKLVAARTGFEFKDNTKMRDALQALSKGANPNDWLGSWDQAKMGMTEEEFYKQFTPRGHEKGEWWTIATERCIYSDKLGSGGRMCFLPE
ncbi:hypothetical protein LJB93_02795 [Desulfovibrio sp. OttesenSCG-928-F07]|nr:hypothetical protein [Desulfovibrio sp. OttesenSCG-928-F07]